MAEWILVLLLALLISVSYPVIRARFFSSVKPGRPAPGVGPEGKNLYEHVRRLAVQIGSRSVYEYDKLNRAKDYIERTLEDLGFDFTLQTFEYRGKSFSNIIVTLPGANEPGKVFIIGAHYDTVFGTPGADDNASAVAALLEICRSAKDYCPSRTLKLIFFVLEEPPAFDTKHMGSYIYAQKARENKEDIYGMISLEMLGYYGHKKGAQTYPLPLMGLFYSNTPDFIGVVGNLASRKLVKKIAGSIKKSCSVPVETLATVKFVPGVDLSDHGSFWKMGYPAVMITDTAFYRNPNYHRHNDTIDTLDFDQMAELLKGLIEVTKDLTSHSTFPT